MNNLAAGIVTDFQADVTLSAVAGPHFGIIPENATFPVCQFVFIGGSRLHTFGNAYLEPVRTQFSIYHNNLETLTTYHNALGNLFDKQQVGSTTTKGRVYFTMIIAERNDGVPIVDKDGLQVYHAVTRIEFVLNKVLA